MDELQNKLGQLLSDPEAMQKLMTLAQSLSAGDGESPRQQAPQDSEVSAGALPGLDASMLRRLSGFASQNRIDNNEQTLLKALGPYLSRERISKLERAMRAAKMAKMATALLGTSGTGR